MIETYLSQENTVLWKAFANSCEDNLSPEVKATCNGGKYCTCSHVFAHMDTHTHTISKMHMYSNPPAYNLSANRLMDAHVQNAQTPKLHTHTHTDVRAFSCGPRLPHIGNTSDRKCQHFLDICSPAVWVYSIRRYVLSCSSFPPVIHTCKLDCLRNNLPTRDCCILDWTRILCEGLKIRL